MAYALDQFDPLRESEFPGYLAAYALNGDVQYFVVLPD